MKIRTVGIYLACIMILLGMTFTITHVVQGPSLLDGAVMCGMVALAALTVVVAHLVDNSPRR